MEASGNMSCNATPKIVRAREAVASMGQPKASFETGYFDVEHLDKHGNVKTKFRAYNGTTLELAAGIFAAIDPDASNILGSASRTAKIALFRNSAANTGPTLLIGDTYATGISGVGASFHTGTFDVVTGWTGADTNGGLTWGINSAGTAGGDFTTSVGSSPATMANTNPTGFTGVGTTNVVGAVVYSENSAGNAGGLIASATFNTGIASVDSADTVNVTFTIQLAVS